MFFSRNSNDVTQIYGPKLSSHVKAALDSNVAACVLDGEVIVWDSEYNRAAPFG
jgi:ATP-dependent DNA ligase